MSSRVKYIAGIALYVIFSARLLAVTDEQLRRIEELGQLNGVALQCRYFLETRRIKQALVAVLPKQRQLGQMFEEASNQTFLAMLKDGRDCPGEEDVAGRVSAAIEELNAAFPK